MPAAGGEDSNSRAPVKAPGQRREARISRRTAAGSRLAQHHVEDKG